MALRGAFSYWLLPIISGVAWLVTLLALLLYWIIHDNTMVYWSMSEDQTIAYISDIGATGIQWLFITGSTISVVTLDLAFIAERWLRHNGRLIANGSRREKVSSILSIFFAIVGAAGLILLTIFDTRDHQRVHVICLGVFIFGYLVSAVFICWEYRRLGINNREHRILRISFWMKLFFIIVEFSLAVAFGVCMGRDQANAAAVLEWVVSVIFTLYAASFAVDLWPAVRTKDRSARFVKPTAYDMEDASSFGGSYPNVQPNANPQSTNF